MKRLLCHKITIYFLCLTLLLFPRPAKASIPTQGQVVGIGVAIAAIGAAIGIGIYFVVRKPPSITGCATSGPDGLTLHNENDTYTLVGDTASFQAGDRVRLTGKKKSGPSGQRIFLVEKVSRNYGACKIAQAHP